MNKDGVVGGGKGFLIVGVDDVVEGADDHWFEVVGCDTGGTELVFPVARDRCPVSFPAEVAELVAYLCSAQASSGAPLCAALATFDPRLAL